LNDTDFTFLQDPTAALTLAEILAPERSSQFRPFPRNLPSFGFSTAAVWGRIDLNCDTAVSVVAELASTRLDHVTWYEVQDGKLLREIRNGWRDVEPEGAAPGRYPAVTLRLEPGQPCTLLFRVTSECSLILPVAVLEASDYTKVVADRDYYGHLQVGASIAVISLSLLLGLTFREPLFTILSLCCAAGFVYGVLFDPVLSLPTWPLPPSASRIGCSISATIASIFMLAFCTVYAGRKNLKGPDLALLAAASLLLLIFLSLHLFVDFRVLNQRLAMSLTLAECCGIWIISSPWRRGRRSEDLIVLLGVLLVHLPALLLTLQLEQIIPTLFPPQSLRFVALPTIISGLICVLIRRRQAAEQMKLNLAKAQAGESEARLAALRFQLNPHMLLNSLTAVSALARTAPEQIPKLVDNLAAILQSRLKPAPHELWTLAEELQLARSLAELERFRFSDSPALKETVDADAARCLLPEMLLQPLVENALKYGRTEAAPAEITITATVDSKRLRITICNFGNLNKIGNSSQGFGIGISNIHARLDLLYGSAAQFTTQQAGRQFTATIELPALEQI
jgi:two-component sensor histidine kinase